MAGTEAGGKKAAETIKTRNGEDFYQRIGKIGGKNGRTGGFYANRKLASIAGRKGGLVSRRGGVNMLKLEIKTPWWGGEKVGIAERRLVSGATMEVTIAYEDKSGNRPYPYTYTMPCRQIKKYPTYTTKGTLLHIVPIKDFEVKDVLV